MSGRTLYMQQRYYDPLAGRFLSVDPVTTDAGTGGHFNRYVYAANNPLKYTDPDGRFFLPAMALGAAAGALINAGVQLYRAEGDVSKLSLAQVSVAAVAGALGGGAGVIANTATTTAGMLGANAVAGAAIGAIGTHASSVVDSGTAAGTGDVLKGAVAGGVLSAAAGGVGAAPMAGAKSAISSMSQTERTSTGNMIKGIADASKGAGGSGTINAAGQGAANAAGATLSNLDNARTSEPNK